MPATDRRPLLPLALTLLAALAALAADPPDLQAMAEATAWRFDPHEATIAACIDRIGVGAYRVRLAESAAGSAPRCIAYAPGGDRFSWLGGTDGVARIVGDRIYVALPNTGTQGAVVFAVDLRTTTLLWTRPLSCLPEVSHSKYANQLNLEADERAVTIFGRESSGRYVAILDAASGWVGGLHRFDPAPGSDGED
jgi:hypothetical protein